MEFIIDILQYLHFTLPVKVIQPNGVYTCKFQFLLARLDCEHPGYRFINNTVQKWKQHFVVFLSVYYYSSISNNEWDLKNRFLSNSIYSAVNNTWGLPIEISLLAEVLTKQSVFFTFPQKWLPSSNLQLEQFGFFTGKSK